MGIDSTASTAAFLVHHLAANPEKQEKLYEEICTVIGPTGKMDEKALGKMRYLKACQTESQRMNPAFFGTSRRLQVLYWIQYKIVSFKKKKKSAHTTLFYSKENITAYKNQLTTIMIKE